jgi:protein TonB
VALPQQQSRPGPPPQQATAAAWHSEAVRIGGAIKPPTKTQTVEPAYPPAAQTARVQGVVICNVLVGADGKVEDARVLRSIPLLDQAALDAVGQWEFSPTLQNGNPMTVVLTVTVNFMLE